MNTPTSKWPSKWPTQVVEVGHPQLGKSEKLNCVRVKDLLFSKKDVSPEEVELWERYDWREYADWGAGGFYVRNTPSGKPMYIMVSLTQCSRHEEAARDFATGVRRVGIRYINEYLSGE